MRELIARGIELERATDRNPASLTLADAALDAITEAGFVIVPKEPTEAMIAAGFEDYPTAWTAAITPEDRVGIYEAMISASNP